MRCTQLYGNICTAYLYSRIVDKTEGRNLIQWVKIVNDCVDFVKSAVDERVFSDLEVYCWPDSKRKVI